MDLEERKRVKVHVSKEDVKAGLKELGLKKGDIVGVHSSLGSFGYVEGGAEAVIDALLEVVGEEGTVVMPTYSTNRINVEPTPEEIAMGIKYKSKVLPYDPKEAPCWTGTIPETFRKRNGAIRGQHPTHSLAAIGPKAEEIVGAGWKKLLELDGYILLIGVGLRVCSAMGLAEGRVPPPKHILDEITPPKWLAERYPPGEWVVGFAGRSGLGPSNHPNRYAKMEEPCLKHKIMKIFTVGESTLKLVRLRELIDLYAEYLKRKPELFYG